MGHTITIHIGAARTTVQAEDGETLLDIMHRAGVEIPAPCGGNGRCGKCTVTVSDETAAGPRFQAEDRFAPAGSGTRLACLAVPIADVAVTVDESTAQIATDAEAKGGALQLERGGAPAVSLETIELEAATLTDQRSLEQRLREELSPVDVPLAALRAAAALSSQLPDGGLTAQAVVSHLPSTEDGHEAGSFVRRLVRLRPGTDWDTVYGLAVDIGTTTVGAYLIDLGRHTVAASASQPNAQGTYGADVLSRIQAVESGKPLTNAIRSQLAELTGRLISSAAVSEEQVVAAVLVGNTTMTHLLLGLDPVPIGRAPFIAQTLALTTTTGADLSLPLPATTPVTVLPGISAYVGADIVSDLLVARMQDADERAVMIDIGTNGEIVLGNRDGLLACSTAAGPAFEGASIRNGSGGIPGAISAVTGSVEQLQITTVADAAPVSICGSGLMDVVAMLLDADRIDETGRLESEDEIDGEPAVRIASDVWLTQGDIRQVQLAKAAVAAGVQTLLEQAGWTVDQLDRVYVSGGFGTFVRPESALRVGLLPAVPVDRITSLGNAAGAGAANALLNRDLLVEATQIAEQCRYVELSSSAVFQNWFIEEMVFG